MDKSGPWSLDQLAEQVEAALSVDYPGAPSGRVRSVPDRRAIRWYTTIGLVDRPVSAGGRTARYGERHLLQLVAIKRLQAAGRSLAQIQAELAGATDGTLRALARLPQRHAAAPEPPAAPRTTRFWSAPAAGPAHAATAAIAADDQPTGPSADTLPTIEATATRGHSVTAAIADGGQPAVPSAFAAAEESVTASPPVTAADGDQAASPSADTIPAAEATATEGPSATAASADGDQPAGPSADAVPAAEPTATAGSSPTSATRMATRPASAAGQRPGLGVDRQSAAPPVGRGESAAVGAVAPAIALPGGVTLLLPPGTPYPASADVTAIRSAAASLLAELGRRGVIATDSTEGTP